MLLRTVVSALICFITVMPFIIIFFVEKTNNKRFRKLLICFSVIYALHYLLIPYLCDAWRIPFDSIILLLYGSIIIGIISYIILIAVNLYNFDKCLVYELEKKHVVIFICLIIMPSFVLCVTYLAQKVRLANSDLIVVYDSDRNGTLFDGDIFAFAQLLRKGYIPHTGSIGDRAVCFGDEGVVNFFPLAVLLIMNSLCIDSGHMVAAGHDKFFRIFIPLMGQFHQLHRLCRPELCVGICSDATQAVDFSRKNLQRQQITHQNQHQNGTQKPPELFIH